MVSPKSVASPVVEIVIKSIGVAAGDGEQPLITPRICVAPPAP